jgi:uncharacterized membrane protein YhaH (DUF805 family)
MTRRRYFLHLFIPPLVLFLWLTTLEGAVRNAPEGLKDGLRVIGHLGFGIGFIATCIAAIRWTCLRIKDAGYPMPLILCHAIPFVGPIFGILIYFTPSNYRVTRKKDGWMHFALALCGLYLAWLALGCIFLLVQHLTQSPLHS